jgi:hypothetical protein
MVTGIFLFRLKLDRLSFYLFLHSASIIDIILFIVYTFNIGRKNSDYFLSRSPLLSQCSPIARFHITLGYIDFPYWSGLDLNNGVRNWNNIGGDKGTFCVLCFYISISNLCG